MCNVLTNKINNKKKNKENSSKDLKGKGLKQLFKKTGKVPIRREKMRFRAKRHNTLSNFELTRPKTVLNFFKARKARS